MSLCPGGSRGVLFEVSFASPGSVSVERSRSPFSHDRAPLLRAHRPGGSSCFGRRFRRSARPFGRWWRRIGRSTLSGVRILRSLWAEPRPGSRPCEHPGTGCSSRGSSPGRSWRRCLATTSPWPPAALAVAVVVALALLWRRTHPLASVAVAFGALISPSTWRGSRRAYDQWGLNSAWWARSCCRTRSSLGRRARGGEGSAPDPGLARGDVRHRPGGRLPRDSRRIRDVPVLRGAGRGDPLPDH